MESRKPAIIAGAIVASVLLLVIAPIAALAMFGASVTFHSAATAKQTVGTLDARVGGPYPAAPAVNSAAGTAQSSYAYPGGGPFQPGASPFGQAGGLSGDGLTSWGVAYKETSDANAQPGADLIKLAHEDAVKRAQVLASASGITMGKLLAISDYTSTQPYFKGCDGIKGVPEPGAPSGTSGSGSGSTGSGTIAPAPAPVPAQSCNQSYYLVAWVTVRFAI